MNSPTDFDIGPLAWVKSEIDLALQRADDALKEFLAGSAQGRSDRTQLRFSRTHLHQVHGALTIVGLDGVTQFADALESLLETAELQPAVPEGAVIALAQRALAAIGHFLDDLVDGQPNQPLRLLPLYREIQLARGEARVAPTDLFFPNLRVRPPRRSGPPLRLGRSDLQNHLRQQRAHFQRGLLSWLRAPLEAAGVQEMRAAVKHVEAVQETPSARSFWWIAGAFMGALAERSLAQDAETRQLCTRIDLQMRRLLEGSKNVAERLMRDALYLVAIADSKDRAVRRVKEAYQLAPLLPAPAASPPVAAEALRRSLRDAIAASEESWNRFCAGIVQALPTFKSNVGTLAALVEDLGQADFRRLVEILSRVAGILNHDPTRHTDALAMEVATAILLAQHALENMQHLEQSFGHQVSVMIERIHDCLTGTPPPPESEHPSLDEMSRRAQEKLLTVQVAKEIQSNLALVEQVLDAFFRDPEKRVELKGLEGPLHQVAGALTMMRHDDAVAVLQACATQIRGFAEAATRPPEDEFERVAEQLSLIGFFVDALQHGATSFATFVDRLRAEPSKAASELAEATVEQEVEQQKIEAHALLVALREQPSDAELRQEIRQNLTALQKDADLVADSELGQQTKQVLSALAAGGDAAEQIDEAMATLKPAAQLAPEPSAKTVMLAQASTEEVDAELLEIFLDEGDEVLVSIKRDLQALRKHPHDVEVLTSIRRSVHTLKGSGRMVGLRDLGEVAWSVEQVLNLWLRQESEVNAPIFDLLGQSYAVFLAWVDHLKTGRGQAPDASGVTSLAASLIGGADTTPALPSAAATEAPAVHLEPASAAVEATADAAVTDVRRVPLAEERQFDTGGEAEFSLPPSLAEIFNDEAKTHLATLQTEFAALAADPLAPTTNEMYRAAHTLASIAGTVGFPAVNRLGRALEMALQRRNSTAHPGNFEALEVVRQTIDELALMLVAIAGRRQPQPANSLVERLSALYPEEQREKPVPAGVATEVSASPAIVELPAAVPAAAAFAGASDGQALRDELDEQLLPLFIDEALDLAQRITQQLLAWREEPANPEVVRGLARLFHTLKGSARMAGAMNLGQMTHTIETRLIEAQAEGQASVELIDDVDSAFDAIVQIVDSLQRGQAAHTHLDLAGEPVSATPTAQPAALHDATVTSEPEHAVSLPEFAEGEGDSSVQRASLRVRADLIDRLVNETGELSIARSRIEGEMRAIKVSLLDLTENVIRLRRQLRDIEIQAETQMQSRTAQAGEGRADFDPLEFDRFTRFQELTRMMAESVNDVATVQQTLLKNLDDANAAILAQARLNREVQQELMSIRMVPFGSIADRLYRIVRQAAKELGKRANLEIRGTQLELDRTVLDKMLAPLEHMLRNAVAHGLETAQVRRARGKPEIGEIALTLTQEGNEIILNFSDDGAGLDLDGLRARGLAAGLLTREQAADDDRVVDLIFVPGVSTASELSQLSGRGIGMDVLRSEVASLGGRIEVASSAGQGTTFRLYLPLTLAVTKALLVRSGSTQYAIPSAMIEQVLDLREKGLARIRDGNFAVWGENRYPFHYLPHLLGDLRALPERHARYWVLLLRSGTNRIATQVDAVVGNQEIVVKNIGPQLARVIGVAGATVLGNGQVVLILNPVALASRVRTQAAVSPVPVQHKGEETAAQAGDLPTVMIVDDSLTVRKITSRLLAREGYQVTTAKNGVEALEQLTKTLPDVMLVDIEMPRMDGFELTRNIRADKRLRKIPIIMITSRTAEKHRQYALDLGVDHYLGKPYQEDELLQLVGQHVKARRDS